MTVSSADERKRTLLRFLTCGSVDDGKSTLLGRLLFEAQAIAEDHRAALAVDSRRYGTVSGELDFALLFDGLEAEREQGITIDVAYRFFATGRRSFIAIDAPGHEQFTRNMATGASHAELAVLLVDATKGILAQTRRHSFIMSLMGIRDVVLAVNKMDLAGFDEAAFRAIDASYRRFAEQLSFLSIETIPLSARHGDNIRARSTNLTWYGGPTLMEYLETVRTACDLAPKPFRFPVQRVNRPYDGFRGLSGTIVSGVVRAGDAVVVTSSGQQAKVARIAQAGGDLEEAGINDAVTLVLDREIDASRGEVLSHPDSRPVVADQFAARLLWMSEEPMLPSRSYRMRIGMNWLPASITTLKYRIDIASGEHLAARTLALNDIGVCNLSASRPIAFDAFGDIRETGAFILVDGVTNQTVAVGAITFALRRASNIHHEALAVDSGARAALIGQQPAVLWFTGLSGAGKSTLARALESKMHRAGRLTYMLDGDNLRHGLNRDLGFTQADRVENIRRVGEVAKLMADAGLIVLCSFISPFRAERKMVREMMGEVPFYEIFVDAPIEECSRRDPKGLYGKARAGQLRNFTGVDSPYEAPLAPDIVVDTVKDDVATLVDRIFDQIAR